MMKRFAVFAFLLSHVQADYELHLLHTNDVHARFDEMNKYGGACKDTDVAVDNCYGGMPRLKTKIEELRTKHPNHLLLDGGDYFQGTIWFHFYKGWSAAHFMNIMKYDAMAVGNHEFDNGPSNTASFARNITFPFLSVNMKFSATDTLLKDLIKKSVVKTVGGQKIGIIGYTTPETAEISRVGDSISFDPIIPALRTEAKRLKSEEGVNKIIAIGHAGFNKDQQVANEVLEVDAVVGGHTDTFLYTGTKPSNEEPVDVYPKVITRSDGSKALVVQDYTFAKYLGHLKIVFDDAGNVKNYSGNPIILDKTVARDPIVQKDIDTWKQPLNRFSELTIGRSFVHLNGSKVACRQRECNMGNLVTDALVFENLNHADSTKWADAPIAIMNSGGIRNSLTKGTITIAKIMSVLPFRNTVDIITIKGATIICMLEHGLTKYEDLSGRFLQFSGLRAWFNMSQPENQRVVKVMARCYQCTFPGYSPLELDKEYRVLVPAYLIEGGDGFDFLADEIIEHHKIGNVDSDMVVQYIHTGDHLTHTIAYGVEGRLNFVNDETTCV